MNTFRSSNREQALYIYVYIAGRTSPCIMLVKVIQVAGQVTGLAKVIKVVGYRLHRLQNYRLQGTGYTG